MKAMILAAGEGQRFQPHSLQLAKPALPLFDVPLIAHAIHYLRLVQVKDIVINVHHLPKTIQKAVGSLGQEVCWSFESLLLGSGGGIYNVKEFFKGEDFIVVNGDCVLSAPSMDFLAKLIEQHNSNKALVTLLSCPRTGNQNRALWCEGKRVKNIDWRGPPHLTPHHYTGWMVFSKRVFKYFPENPKKPFDIFDAVVQLAIQRGELVETFYIEGLECYETGNLSSYLKAQKNLLTHMQPEHPHAHFVKSTYKRFLDYEIDIHNLQWISPHCTLLSPTGIGDNVVICSGARINKEVFIDNSVVSWGVSLTKTTVHFEMAL